MSFWSAQKFKLKHNESEIVSNFDETRIQGSSYELSVGEWVYFTSDRFGKKNHRLTVGESIEIPKGHFAIISTEEQVKIPKDAMAFISVKAGIKMKGLVNVSGFHVDPGYNDYLRFGVYNSGTNDIHISRGQPLFLIFMADLNEGTDKVYLSEPSPKSNIPVKFKQNMTGEVLSLPSISERLNRLETYKRNANWILGISSTLIGFGITFLIMWLTDSINFREKVIRLEERSSFNTTLSERVSKLELMNHSKIISPSKKLEQRVSKEKFVETDKTQMKKNNSPLNPKIKASDKPIK